MLLALSVSLWITADLERVSELSEPQGLFERWENPKDEREYSVRLKRPNGSSLWIETVKAPDHFRQWRRPASFEFAPAGAEEVLLENDKGKSDLLGFSPRVFEKECSAMVWVNDPTPLQRARPKLLERLKCSEKILPLPEDENLRVYGKDLTTDLKCSLALPGFCKWDSFFAKEEGMTTLGEKQIASLYALRRIRENNDREQLRTKMEPLSIVVDSIPTNSSIYDAIKRTLNFGAGKMPDALDGFIVVHEWIHAMIDDTNRGFFGYFAQMLHEGIADFMASDLFNNACFAPYDAQEILGRSCLRNLDNAFVFPKDVTQEDPHQDGQIISGTLWDLRSALGSELTKAISFETIIRIPKNPSPEMWWSKMRISLERNLKDSGSTKASDFLERFDAVGTKRGFHL